MQQLGGRGLRLIIQIAGHDDRPALTLPALLDLDQRQAGHPDADAPGAQMLALATYSVRRGEPNAYRCGSASSPAVATS